MKPKPRYSDIKHLRTSCESTMNSLSGPMNKVVKLLKLCHVELLLGIFDMHHPKPKIHFTIGTLQHSNSKLIIITSIFNGKCTVTPSIIVQGILILATLRATEMRA